MTCFSDGTYDAGREPDAPGPGPDGGRERGGMELSAILPASAEVPAPAAVCRPGGCAGGPRPQPWAASRHSQSTFSLNGLKNPLRLLGGELKGFYFIFRNTSDFCLHVILNLKLVTKRMRIVHCGVSDPSMGISLGSGITV